MAAVPQLAIEATPESAWTALRRRLQGDRVGAVSLVIVIAYLVMILFATSGWLAGGWSQEVGVPYANPAFLGERPNLEAALHKRMEHKGKMPDLRAVDPLAPKYDEWAKRTGELKSTEPERSLTLPWGGDRWGRNVLDKAIKGSQV
jgi:oligopeptide transport system permease protein